MRNGWETKSLIQSGKNAGLDPCTGLAPAFFLKPNRSVPRNSRRLGCSESWSWRRGSIGRTLLRPVVGVGFLSACWKYGVDFEKSSPEEAVAASSVPVLLIHGTADTNLPIRHSRRILAHAAGRQPAVVFWEVSGAGHCGAQGAAPGAYEQRVVSWFASHR
jgi:pimeloyl-ACP methyl ester carboxylesterase